MQPSKVSSPREQLILVDQHDSEIGVASKADCHFGDGLLHRAFSALVFDSEGRLLLQQRAASKPLWPLYWSNSCCSHPRAGESMDTAVRRRVLEELGMQVSLQFLYKFSYRAEFFNVGVEHEVCSVYAGVSDAPVRPHPEEVAAWRYVTPDVLDRELHEAPEMFTPWFRLEWQRVRHTDLGALLSRRPEAQIETGG